MSAQLFSDVFEHAPYDGGMLQILLALADAANDAGECTLSLATLAVTARIGTSRTLTRHLRRLIHDGAMSCDGDGEVRRFRLDVTVFPTWNALLVDGRGRPRASAAEDEA